MVGTVTLHKDFLKKGKQNFQRTLLWSMKPSRVFWFVRVPAH